MANKSTQIDNELKESPKKVFDSKVIENNQTHIQQRWISPEPNTLGVRFGFAYPSLSFDIQDDRDLKGTQSRAQKIKYIPNVATRTSLSLFYSHFSLTASLANPLSSEDLANKGSSRVEDYQFRFYHRRGTFDVFYQNYKGYYVDNTNDIDPEFYSRNSLSSSHKLTNENLRLSHFGLQYVYLDQPNNYSLGGTFDQSIRQSLSGGSLLYSLYAGKHQIQANEGIIPLNAQSDYGILKNFNNGDIYNLRIGIGYGYTYVYRGYYAGGLFGISYGLQNQIYNLKDPNLNLENISVNKVVPGVGGSFRLGLGFNGKKYFSGLQFVSESTNMKIEEFSAALSTIEVRVFLGQRLGDISIPFINQFGDWLFGKD